MNKMTFTCSTDYEGVPPSFVHHETEAATLPEVLAAFELFLRGSGYCFKGNLEIVDDGGVE